MKILAFAYACEPERGSEPGAGWAWARMLAQQGETWVITRRDYRLDRGALEAVPERESLHFVYVELPDRFRRWQRDLHGLRAYYLLWQFAALKEARRSTANGRFRRCVAPDLGDCLVWLPRGGGRATIRLRPSRWVCRHRLAPAARAWDGRERRTRSPAWPPMASRGTLNPLARHSWRRADLILAQNVETRDWFPRRHRAKVRLFPNAVIREDLMRPAGPGEPSAAPDSALRREA